MFRSILVTLIVASAATAAAQDRVVIRRSGGTLAVTGTIEDYKASEIRIRTSAAEIQSFPAAEVVDIQTAQVPPHANGLKLWEANRPDAAAREFEAALKIDPRVWMRRELLALLVRCALRQGDYRSAGSRFLLILKSDPETRHFGLIPLVWSSRTITPEETAAAKGWLLEDSDAAHLLGASLLYDDPQQATAARAELRRLSTSADGRIRTLAQTQGWREEIAAGTVNDLQLARWQERIEAMPRDLRMGPRYLLGRGYIIRRDYPAAAATLLFIPLVDDHDHHLAGQALLEAGQSLIRIGRHAEADVLLREAADRFTETAAGAEARALLHREAQGRYRNTSRN
jgi:tetratricopeptide (TPR) repeat protein